MTWNGNGTRDIGEYYRLQAQSASNSAVTACDGVTYCNIGTMIDHPRPYQLAHGLPENIISMSCQEDTLAFSACAPSVVFLTPLPTSSSFSHKNVYAMDMSAPIDSRYGNYYNMLFTQNMVDPLGLYNSPCPCRIDLPCDSEDDPLGYDCFASEWTWTQDQYCLGIQDPVCDGLGGLLLSGADYYAMPPSYAAVCNPPSGSPAMPAGIYLNCLTQAQVNVSGSLPTGSLCLPPTNGVILITPWLELLYKNNCVCANGRFAQYYLRNYINCDNLLVIGG